MEKLIEVINKIQETYTSIGVSCPFDLPQIVVVGEQSAGKSSVLENFVGRDFLPRGSGIVTRRPLVLQLITCPNKEYAEFLHKPDMKYTNFLDVRKEIEIETDRLTGSNKSISSIPINLKIYSPNVLNLTLVDLPGLTKVPVGDQPQDIDKQIREMILLYISNKNSLILAIIPAVMDLANSEALKLAIEVDPNRERTIGVITKIDMMSEGTDCLQILNNELYPLKYGYVGVVNRSQNDIDSKKDIKAAQEAEIKYFKSSLKYNNILNKVGTKYLQEKLSLLLMEKIKQCIPKLKDAIKVEVNKIDMKIKNNPDAYLDKSDGNNNIFPIRIISSKIHLLTRKIDSIFGIQYDNIDLEETSYGSKIRYILNEQFTDEINKCKEKPERIMQDIKMAINNTRSLIHTSLGGGVPFFSVTKSLISNTEDVCLNTVHNVVGECRKLLHNCIKETFEFYPNLLNESLQFINEQIDICYERALGNVKYFMRIQIEHINTNHPDFLISENLNPSTIISKHGHANIINSVGFKSQKEYYLELRGDSLFIYKNNERNKIKEQLLIANCLLKDTSAKQKFVLNIYTKDNRFLYKNNRSIEISCKNKTDHNDWFETFINIGLENQKPDDPNIAESQEYELSVLKNSRNLYYLVDTYINIFYKLQQDLISKICIYCIICNIRDNIVIDLSTFLHSFVNRNGLGSENEKMLQEREQTLRKREFYLNTLNCLSDTFNYVIDDNITKSYNNPKTNLNLSSGSSKSINIPLYNEQVQPKYNLHSTKSDDNFNKIKQEVNNSSINQNKAHPPNVTRRKPPKPPKELRPKPSTIDH